MASTTTWANTQPHHRECIICCPSGLVVVQPMTWWSHCWAACSFLSNVATLYFLSWMTFTFASPVNIWSLFDGINSCQIIAITPCSFQRRFHDPPLRRHRLTKRWTCKVLSHRHTPINKWICTSHRNNWFKTAVVHLDNCKVALEPKSLQSSQTSINQYQSVASVSCNLLLARTVDVCCVMSVASSLCRKEVQCLAIFNNSSTTVRWLNNMRSKKRAITILVEHLGIRRFLSAEYVEEQLIKSDCCHVWRRAMQSKHLGPCNTHPCF